MEQKLDDTLAILERTPRTVDALLRGLPEAWLLGAEGAATWSPRDIVGHYIHCDRTDWMPRARMILQCGESQEFEPFDRAGHVEAIQGKSTEELLDELAETRVQSLVELRGWNLGPAELALRGRHPKLGPVTMSQLLATWAAHDLNHLHQMTRVMAHQYREAVGPFAAYMGVMHCHGHGA